MGKMLRECECGATAALAVGVLKCGKGVHMGAASGNFQVLGESFWIDSYHGYEVEQK